MFSHHSRKCFKNRFAKSESENMITRPLYIQLFNAFVCGATFLFLISAKADGITKKIDTPVLARSAGTAFSVNEQGHLITANHIIQDAENIVVFAPGEASGWRAKVVKVSKKNDLAILKIDSKTRASSIAEWATVPNGLEIFAFGFPNPSVQGRELKITSGLVNSLEGLSRKSGVFQFSAPIQRGNSGGPVVAPDGSVVGLISGKLESRTVPSSPSTLGSIADLIAGNQENRSNPGSSETLQNVNFAVRSDELLKFLQDAEVPYTARNLDLKNSKKSHEIFKDVSPTTYTVVAIRGGTSVKEVAPSTEFLSLIRRLPSDQQKKINGAFKAGFGEVLELGSEQVLLNPTSIKIDKSKSQVRSFDFILSLGSPKKFQEKTYFSSINSAKFDCKDSSILLIRQEHKTSTFGTGETVSAMKRRADAAEDFKVLGSKSLTQFFFNNVCQSVDNAKFVSDQVN